MFVLLGRDTTAPVVVSFWQELRKQLGTTSPEVLAEAETCQENMAKWAVSLGKDPLPAWNAQQAVLSKAVSRTKALIAFRQEMSDRALMNRNTAARSSDLGAQIQSEARAQAYDYVLMKMGQLFPDVT